MLFDLTVGQYQLLREIDEDLTAMEQNIYAVAALKGITYDEARKVKWKDFNNILSEIQQIDVTKLERQNINNKILLNGRKYHIEHNPDKLTSGQILDIINIRSHHAGEPIKVMDLLMAAMSRLEGGEYGSDKLTLAERAKYCRGVKMAEVWNIYVFFCNLWSHYLKGTEDSLIKWMEETPKKVQEILDEGGDSLA